MSRIRSIAAGATWIYGGQLTTIAIQFLYAAITSRAVDDVGFGIYSIALAISALLSLIAGGGLAQTAGRMLELAPRRVSAIAYYGLLLGLAAATLLLATADVWAAAWSTPEASGPTRVMAITVFFAPFYALSTGLLRRQNRYRILAGTTLAGNILGMGAGTCVVLLWPSPTSLLVSPVLSQAFIAITAAWMNRSLFSRFARLSDAGPDIRYSGRLTATSIVGYLNGNVGKWAISTGLGAAPLGQWNRADVVTTVPFHSIQAALIQAVYPEFRHDIGSSTRARRVWTDMLNLVAWLAWPLAAVAAVIVPAVMPVLFGPGWGLASALATPLALVGGLQIVAATLSSGIEALGRFRWLTVTLGVQAAVYVGAASAAIATQSLVPIVAGLFTATLGQHVIQVAICSRRGYLAPWTLYRGYLSAAGFSAAAAGFMYLSLLSISYRSLAGGTGLAILLLTVTATAWRFRHHLPPLQIAMRYGLGGAGRR